MFSDILDMRWSTPIATRILDDAEELNTHLETTILKLQEIDIGINISNFMGWHSTGNLLHHSSHDIDTLNQILIQFVADYVVELSKISHQIPVEISAWANVLNKGGYHSFHKHANCHLSGVYYVKPGEPDPGNLNSGLISFSDPRGGADMISNPYLDFGSSYQYVPIAGMLLLFPAYLPHWVHPFTGEGKRITISFNVKFIESASDKLLR